MIVQTQLEVRRTTHPEIPPVYLAPFDEHALAAAMPIDPKSAPYERKSTVEALTTMPPAVIAESAERRRFTNTFGIYSGAVESHRFAGVVELTAMALSHAVEGKRVYTREAQTIGLHIYRAEQQGLGLGSAAIMGVMRYGRLMNRTIIFDAWTSEKNEPMQHILDKHGFVETEDRERIHHYKHGKSWLKRWVFADPEAAKHVRSPVFGQDLLDGYDRYTALTKDYSVEVF
jgi:RimJ/RimL family protein N-acetyltransferase